MFGLGILSRKENCASTEVQMLDLDSYELSDSTAQFIDNFKHQLVIVVVDAVEELRKLLDGEIADHLSEAFVFLRMSWLLVQTLSRRSRISVLFRLHVNVKSEGFINVSKRMLKVVVRGRKTRPVFGPKLRVL
jgi:hypothetical protein